MKLRRRSLMLGALAGCVPQRMGRPEPRWGVQSGDVDATSAVIWSRSSVPARMQVEWSLSPRFDRAVRVEGPLVGPATDLTGKVRLTNLPSATPIHYRAWFDDSEWVLGSLRTAPSATDPRNVLLAWSGDVNGQGWGIDAARGGMPAFTALRERRPELFIHCGDAIYADVPIQPLIPAKYGGPWHNWIDPEGARGAAQTLADFRAYWRYARHSAEVRACSAAVPIVAIWDDHEVRDNWYPSQVVADVVASDLMGAARRAMHEHLPTLRDPALPMYRVVSWGPLVDVFLLDGRSWRSSNDPPPERAGMLGDVQADWLIGALKTSRARWKLVANGQPIADAAAERGATTPVIWDCWGNTGGPPQEREVELARILTAIRGVSNVVWISADVHYGAARRFDPMRASYKDFDPFWELVAGPMHAATFPANPIDNTFGPESEWLSAGEIATGNPANGEQYIGLLAISDRSLDVTWVDARGRDLHRLAIPAA